MAENRELLENVINRVDNLNINTGNSVNGSLEGNHTDTDVNKAEKWGFPLSDLYKLGLKFYKGKRTHLHINNSHCYTNFIR